MRSSRIALVGALAGLIGAALAPASATAFRDPGTYTITFNVRDESGRPQTLLIPSINGDSMISAPTDQNGQLRVDGLDPGDVVTWLRGTYPQCDSPPEAPDGVSYTVPSDNVPATVDITLPDIMSAQEFSEGTQISAAEDEFLALINRARRKRGLEPLYISTTLSAAAYWATIHNQRVCSPAYSPFALGFPGLVVLPTDVVNAADRRPVAERAVGSSPVVIADEGSQSPDPLR